MSNDLLVKIHEFLNVINQPNYITNQINSLTTYQLTDVYAKNRGIIGLHNLGNSCYMNSLIQCLRHTMILNEKLFSPQTYQILLEKFKQTPNKGFEILTLVHFMKIIYIMWDQDTKLSPIGFKIILGKSFEQFCDQNQHDAHELLLTLLQSFHESLSYLKTQSDMCNLDFQFKKAHDDWINCYKNQHSIILDIFGGQLKTELKCLNCHESLYKFDPILVIDLPVVPNGDIYQSLDHFVNIEQLNEHNLYQCDFCHEKTRAYKKHSFWNVPEILIIKFNRFQHQFVNGVYQSEKINDCINYPICGLDLSKYLSPQSTYLSTHPSTHPIYNLYAINCHTGTMSLGHYYSICYNVNKNMWIGYNDHQIGILNPITNEAYMLFYKKDTS